MDQKLRIALETGRELYVAREYARAEPYLSQVAAANVPYADVYNMLGVIHHDQGHFSKAQSCFEEALRINPGYTEAGLNLAVTYNDMGKYQEARETYRAALGHSATPGTRIDAFTMGKIANMYSEIAQVYATAGALEDAISEYRRALALRPQFVDIRLKLAETLRDAGRAGEALTEVNTLLEHNPAFTPGRIFKAITEFSAGNAEAAARELEGVLQGNPDHSRARAYLEMIRTNASRQGGG